MRLGIALLVFAVGCAAQEPAPAPSLPSTAAQGPVRTGAKVLADEDFASLEGLRVGLVVNHTARVDTAHLADLLYAAPGVELAALFGPEHGLRGQADAGDAVSDGRDARTGVPIYSLYGDTRKPTPAMLDGVDVLIFDIQDVGARFYTYISTMGLAMQAAAEAGIPFVVLDRPNPLGGTYVSGFVLEPAHDSFVGFYPIPVAHGLTVGELAAMLQGEGLLPGLDSLDLSVVPMEGWARSMPWSETGLPWIPPSPNIPDAETALVYAGTCFFEALNASEGRGTRQPFKQVGATWADAEALATDLNARTLPGVRFEAVTFTPVSIPGMSASPRFREEAVAGIRYAVTDPGAFRPVEAGIYVIDAFRQQAERRGQALVEREDWLTKLAGTERLGALLKADASPETIIAAWEAEVSAFRERRRPYLLYRDTSYEDARE